MGLGMDRFAMEAKDLTHLVSILMSQKYPTLASSHPLEFQQRVLLLCSYHFITRRFKQIEHNVPKSLYIVIVLSIPSRLAAHSTKNG